MPNSKNIFSEADLKSYTLEELEEMQATVRKRIEKELQVKKKEALEQIKTIAQENELSFDEIVQAIRTQTKRGKAPAIYRNPDRPRQTWSGKGEAPDWFKKASDKEALRIPGA